MHSEYHDDHFGAFVRDPHGIDLEAVCRPGQQYGGSVEDSAEPPSSPAARGQSHVEEAAVRSRATQPRVVCATATGSP